MAEESGEKSFDATPHRRQQAREKGQIAYSQDLGSAALLLVAAGLLQGMGGGVVNLLTGILQQGLGEVGPLAGSQQDIVASTVSLIQTTTFAILPMLMLLVLAGVGTSVFQVGLLFVPSRIAPDISRLSVIKGLQRIFSLQGTARLGFGMLKVLVVTITALVAIWLRRHDILNSAELTTGLIAQLIVDLTITTLLWVGVALLVLALADFAFQRWKHEQDLKMTFQEMREEMKNLQGDPQIAARRRAVQRQMAMNRMGGAVPQADVVVTNPTELAIAIKYDYDKMLAPVVVAKGAGLLAQRIRRLALENNVPIVERKPLAQLLYKEVDVNHPVPDSSYAAVAEVLAYVYQLKGKKLPDPNRRTG